MHTYSAGFLKCIHGGGSLSFSSVEVRITGVSRFLGQPNVFFVFFFFLNDPPTTEFYPLPLHAPLPISRAVPAARPQPGGDVAHHQPAAGGRRVFHAPARARPRRDSGGTPRSRRRARRVGLDVRRQARDRKSTRLNSSHSQISYAVFCLK